MFFAILYCISCCLFGFEIISFFLIKVLDFYSLVALGSTFGIIVSGWFCYISNLLFSPSFSFGLFHTIINLSLSYLFYIKRPKVKYLTSYSSNCLVYSAFGPSLLVCYFIYFGLLYDGKMTKGASFSDIPFHMNIISSFAYGCNSERKSIFDLISPYYAKEKLAYPIIPDYISAIYLKCFETSYLTSLVITSLVFAVAIFIILARIVFEFSKSELPCYIAPWLFLFDGGTGFIDFIIYPGLRNQFYTDFVFNIGERKCVWFHSILHYLLPQRAALHALPICYSIILCLILGAKRNRINFKLYFIIGILISSLPQIQPHSVIGLAEYGIVHFILRLFPLKKRKVIILIINYGILAIVSLILGFPQTLPFFERTSEKKFMKFGKIWKMNMEKSFFSFWWKALGVIFILSIVHGPSIMTKRQFGIYLPALITFLISNFIRYQPWAGDNNKIFYTAWIPFVVASAANYLASLLRKETFGYILFTLLMFFSCFSGILAVRTGLRESYNIWTSNSIPENFTKFVRENTPPKSIWISDTWHSNPLITLCGRQTFLGYQGWVSSHGLNIEERTKILNNFQSNPDNTSFTDAFGIEYVLIHKGNNKNDINIPESSKWKEIYLFEDYRILQRVNESET